MSSKGRGVPSARTQPLAGKAAQRSFPSGRTCTQCGEPLSRYNPGPNCWQHTSGIPWAGPTARPRR